MKSNLEKIVQPITNKLYQGKKGSKYVLLFMELLITPYLFVYLTSRYFMEVYVHLSVQWAGT